MRSTIKAKAARLSIISNFLLIVLKLSVGLLTGSVSIISEAIHSGLDWIAALIAFLSIKAAARPADEEHPFGHGKVENISAAVEAALIFIAAGLIIYEAVQKLLTGSELKIVELGIGVMLISVIANAFVSRYLLRIARKTNSPALEADAAHLTTDVLTSLGVLAGLVAIRLTGLRILDPLIALVVALLIIKAAWGLVRKASGALMDARLSPSEERQIKQSLQEHGGDLLSFHALRTRSSGSERYIDLHLVVHRKATVEEAHRLCDHLEQDIKVKLPDANITIHVEPCEAKCEQCPIPCPEKEQ